MDVEYVNCPICDVQATGSWLDDGKATRYVRCRNCGTVYASPRSSRTARFAWLNSSFATSEKVHNLSLLRKPALELEARLIHSQVSGGEILDVGCSTGAFFEFFPAPAWKCHGVELSPSAAEYASVKHAARVHPGTLESAAFDARAFDLVTMIDTLYYVDDPVGELHEIRRILKPNGKLAVEIAGQAYILWRTFGFAARILDGCPARAGTDSSYIYWYSPVGLERLLEKCGFRAVAWHVIPSPPNSGLRKVLASAHYSVARGLRRLSQSFLTFAPKYLCIAQPVEG